MKLALAKSEPLAEIAFERELLLAPNGSTVAVDWFNHPEDVVKDFQGIVIIFTHGLTRDLSRQLINSVLRQTPLQRLSVCIVTVQGSNGIALSSPQTGLRLSALIEFKAATERINQHLGSSFPKAAVACSIGAIPVVEYIEQEKSGYSSMILISTPLDVGRFAVDENEVTDYLLNQGKQILKDNADVLTRSDIEDFSKATDATTLNEFLTHAVGKASIGTWDPYRSLDAIQRPTLMLYALDDESIQFSTSIDLVRLCRNPNIAVAVTEVGGHCGFQFLQSDWLANCICEFASSASKPVL